MLRVIYRIKFFVAHMGIVLILKVKCYVVIKWSHTPPKIMFINKPWTVNNFEHIIQPLWNTYQFVPILTSTPNHTIPCKVSRLWLHWINCVKAKAKSQNHLRQFQYNSKIRNIKLTFLIVDMIVRMKALHKWDCSHNIWTSYVSQNQKVVTYTCMLVLSGNSICLYQKFAWPLGVDTHLPYILYSFTSKKFLSILSSTW